MLLDVPSNMTRYLQPLDSGPAFGHMKKVFRRPGTDLKQILRVLTHFPTWVGSRTEMWKTVYPDFKWDEVCGEDTPEERDAWRKLRIEVNTGEPLTDSDESGAESFTTDPEDYS
jgi:hypothetical protein